METISTSEIAGRRASVSKHHGVLRRRSNAKISLEERNDLTISEIEALGITDSCELIDGRIIFKMATSDHSYIQLKLAATFDAYLSKGNKVVWIVIPAKACVLVLTANGRRWEYDTVVCPELLPDWSMNLGKIFNWPTEEKTA